MSALTPSVCTSGTPSGCVGGCACIRITGFGCMTAHVCPCACVCDCVSLYCDCALWVPDAARGEGPNGWREESPATVCWCAVGTRARLCAWVPTAPSVVSGEGRGSWWEAVVVTSGEGYCGMGPAARAMLYAGPGTCSPASCCVGTEAAAVTGEEKLYGDPCACSTRCGAVLAGEEKLYKSPRSCSENSKPCLTALLLPLL